MSKPKENASPHFSRWIWFLDVLFAGIAAIILQQYEPIVRCAWASGPGTFSLSVFVAMCMGSFFVYDVAVYHALANKFPYRMTLFGFARFYLDLVMAFVLFMLLMDAFNKDPDWFNILITITSWHALAFIWHVLAQREARKKSSLKITIIPHVYFVSIYWSVAWVSYFSAQLCGFSDATQSDAALVALSAAIAAISFWRWRQVIQKLVGM